MGDVSVVVRKGDGVPWERVRREARRQRRSRFVSWLLCICLGWLGLHKFYLGRKGWGFVYLFTIGLGGLGWLYDIFTLNAQIRAANEQIVDRIASEMAPVEVRLKM